jgi:hypothetical protein
MYVVMLTPTGQLPARNRTIEHLKMLCDAARTAFGLPSDHPQVPETRDTKLDEPTVSVSHEDLEPTYLVETSMDGDDPFGFSSFESFGSP